MMADAEAHAEDDRQRRDQAEVRNLAEGLQYTTEKFLADNGDKIPADKKTELEAALEDVKKTLEGNDTDAIKAAHEKLSRVSQETGSAMYEGAGAALTAMRRTPRPMTTPSLTPRSLTRARPPMSDRPDEVPDRVIIRDKRRIDPATGQQREPDPEVAVGGVTTTPPTAETDETVTALESAVAERTAAQQRLQAEYANYRKRVERDRITVRDIATADVLVALLPVLDDIDRARTHDDLTGAFKAVADQLDATIAKLGLTPFGDVGDPFDPAQHEAVMHTESDQVDSPTVTTVMRRGYTFADRLVRPAMVGVSEPAHADSPTE